MRRVQVLLSTYNGAAFVAEQIKTVLNQEGVAVELLIRDDASQDETPTLLEKWANDPRVTIRREENVGVPESFFRLLAGASEGVDYYAFCDQDDVWAPDKLARAVQMLDARDPSKPQLYCSRLTLTDEGLRPIGLSDLFVRPLAFENAVVQNVVTGCTTTFNRAARELLTEHSRVGALMHDWWLYLVAAAFGEVHYDPEPRILYRQHGGNAIGLAPGQIARWVTRIRRFVAKGREVRVIPQLVAFRAAFGARLSTEQERVIDELIRTSPPGWLNRFRVAVTSPVYRMTFLDNVVLRVFIASGRL